MPDVSSYKPDPITALRLLLLGNGYEPIPTVGKVPRLDEWQIMSITPTDWRKKDGTNTGVRCGLLRGVDIDVRDADLSARLVLEAERILGANPLRRIGQAPKVLIPYRTAVPGNKQLTPELFLPDGTKAQVEVLAKGQQFIAYGTHPDTKSEYTWDGGGLDVAPLAELPQVSEEAISSFVSRAEALIREAGGLPKDKAKARNPTPRVRSRNDAPDREEVADALRAVPNCGSAWNKDPAEGVIGVQTGPLW